jgi:hypothetical protein
MQYLLWTLASLVGYVAGLAILTMVTPRLLRLSYDEGLFMGIAALDVIAALLVFGAVAIMYAVYNGELAIRGLDFFLLLGIIIVTARMSWRCLRSGRFKGANPVSRILAGVYCLLLCVAAMGCMGVVFA